MDLPRSAAGVADTGPPSGTQPGLNHADPPAGVILDLVTGAEGLTDSLASLTRTAAAAMGRAADSPTETAMVLLLGKRGSLAAATCGDAHSLAQLELDVGEGPLTDALAGNSPTAMNHVERDFRWPLYRSGLRAAGFRSAVGIRFQLGDGAESALVFLGRGAHAFHRRAMAEAAAFEDLGSRSLRLLLELRAARNSAADLRSALESRTSIDVACGVIMAQNRCSYGEAIAIMTKASSHRNLKLRRVAEDILEKLPGGAPRPHFDH